MKMTNQRLAILTFLKGSKAHPTPEEVFKEVKKDLPCISKATVYKNLKVLTQEGLVNEVNVKGTSRFEANIIPHHHIICRDCSKIIDFENEELSEFALTAIKTLKEYEIDSAQTNFYGTCQKCRGKR